MKIKIRHSLFETNSSSTHTLTIMKGKEYDKLSNGHFKLDSIWGFEKHEDVALDKIYTKDEALQLKKYYNSAMDDNIFLRRKFITLDESLEEELYNDDCYWYNSTETITEEIKIGNERYVAVSQYTSE